MNVMLSRFLALFSFFFFAVPALNADAVLLTTFENAPRSVIESVKKELSSEEKAALNVEKECEPSLSGIPCIYGGYYALSKEDGRVALPLRQVAKKIYLVITPSIRLAALQGETKSNVELELINEKKAVIGAGARIYLCEQKTESAGDAKAPNSPETKGTGETTYWSISEQNVLPSKLSPLSLVIIAQPSNLVVKTGDFMTEPGSHFVLPAIYVVGQTSRESLAGFAEVKKYLEQITEASKQEDKKAQSTIENH